MNKIQKEKPDQKWLFRNINEANKTVKTIRKRAIIMLGLTRVGKSTLYNSIINPQSLIGEQIEANCYYVPATFGGPAARISHRMVSETLLPNMRNIAQNFGQVTLIDMPGAGQRREGSIVLLTSYALTKVFQILKDAKFILVMTQSSYLSIADNCFRNTFQEFLFLFNFKEMRPEIREQLFKSVSLVITSVRPTLANKLLGQLSLNLKNLKDLYNQNMQYMPNFEYCQMLINSLIQSNRVQPFLLAEHGKPPKISTVLSSLNNKRWRYCEMKNVIKQVEYPYVRYFKLYLNQSEQKQVQQLIKTRFNQLRHLQSLLDDIILLIKDNICNKNIGILPVLDQIKKQNVTIKSILDQIKKQNVGIKLILDNIKKQNVTIKPIIDQINQQNVSIMHILGQINQQNMNIKPIFDQINQQNVTIKPILGQINQQNMNIKPIIDQINQQNVTIMHILGQINQQNVNFKPILDQISKKNVGIVPIINQINKQNVGIMPILSQIKKQKANSIHILDQIKKKNVSIIPKLHQIKKKFILGDYYQDMPSNLMHKFFSTSPNVVNLKNRIQKIFLIQNHNKKLKLIFEWRSQIKTQGQNLQEIQNSVYYEEYLLKHFNQGIQHVVDLCCNQDANTIFAQIRHIFNKLFFQASTLDCLRKGSDLKDFNLRSILQNNINQNLFLIREEDENKMVMEIFKKIYNYNFDTAELSFQEIEDIIAYFFTLEQKYPELDSIQVYKLLYKLKKVKIQKIQKEVKKDREIQILREKLVILYYYTCHIISLQYVQNASDSERIIQTLHLQREIASDIVRFLYAMGGPMLDLAHKVCEILHLYKDRSFLYQKQIQTLQKQRNPRKLNIIKAAAEHQQKIGNTTKSIQLYNKFRKEGGKTQNGIDPIIQVRNNAKAMIETSQKCEFEQERTPLKSQKVFQCLRLCFTHIFNLKLNWPFNIEEIGSAYRAKMAKMNQQGQINKQLPKKPEPIQLIEQCSQMINICKDKKLTILLGSRRFCGLTTLAYALQKKRFITFKDSKYQLEINSKSSKINHNSSSPNQFPNIFKINQEEWIIDFPNIFPYDPEIALIKANILEKFIQQSNGFRIILATSQEGFLQSQSAQIIRLLKFIINIFPQKQFGIEKSLGFAITMFSTGEENTKKIRQAEKQLQNRFKKAKGNQMQIIENQKKFKLTYAEQMEISQILKEVFKTGRILRFQRPHSQQVQNTMNFLEQATKKGQYINRQIFMEPRSMKIGTFIQSQFQESESQKVIGTFKFLVNQIKEIFSKLSLIVDKKLDELLQNTKSFPPQFDKIEGVLKKCQTTTNKSKLFSKTGKKYQVMSELQKIIVCYRDIIQHLVNDSMFEEYYLPDDCILFIDKTKIMIEKMFKKVINFVCQDDADTVPIASAQSTVYIFLNYLRWICGPLVLAKGKLREVISQLRIISNSFQWIFNTDYNNVIKSFRKKVKFQAIMKLTYNDQKQNALIHYIQIINMISKVQNSQQLSQMKKMANQNLRELYTKNGKSKQLCLIILQQIQQKTKQKLEKLPQMRKLFRSVAENIVLLHPKLGLQICYMSNMPAISDILCRKIIQYSADPWKQQAYIELYILLQNRNEEDLAQEVHDNLLAFIGNSHPDYLLLSSPNGIKQKSLKFQTKLKLQLNPKIILQIVSYIKQQINQI